MSFNAAALRLMLSKGLTLGDVAEIAEANERRRDNTGAERQARFRQRKGRNAVTVTPLSPNDNSILTPEELPQEANASLPQGAKTRWDCPEGVDPGHWRDFLKNRKRKRCATTQTALDTVLTDLAEIADDEWPPGRLVQYAAGKGWASINDPRKPKYEQQSTPSYGKTAATFALLSGGRDEPF